MKLYVQEFMDNQPYIIYNKDYNDDLVSYTIPVHIMQQIINELLLKGSKNE